MSGGGDASHPIAGQPAMHPSGRAVVPILLFANCLLHLMLILMYTTTMVVLTLMPFDFADDTWSFHRDDTTRRLPVFIELIL